MTQIYTKEVDGTTYDLFNEEERTSYINAATQAELGRNATSEEMAAANQNPDDYDFDNFRGRMYDTDAGHDHRVERNISDGEQRANDWVAENYEEGETFQAGSAGDITIFNPDDAALFTNGYYNIADEYAIGWQNDEGEWTGGSLDQYPGGKSMMLIDKGTTKRTLGQAAMDWTGVDEVQYLDPDHAVIKAADALGQEWLGDLVATASETSRLNMNSVISPDPERINEGTRSTWEGIGINDYYKYSDQVQEAAAAVVGGIFGAGYGGAVAYTAVKLAHSARDQYQYGNVDWGKVAISIGTAWATAAIGSKFASLRAGANASAGAGGAVGSATANSAYTMNTIGLAVGEGALRVAVGTASGLAQGGDFDEVLISSTASAISSQVMNYAGQHIPDTVSGELFRMQVTGASAYAITKLAGGDDDRAKLSALTAVSSSGVRRYFNEQNKTSGQSINIPSTRRYIASDFALPGSGSQNKKVGQ